MPDEENMVNNSLSKEGEAPGNGLPDGPIELVPEVNPNPPATEAKPIVQVKPVDLKNYTTDIKIVVTVSKNSVMIGLQKSECDPRFYQVKDLEGAIKGIPVFLDMAEKSWAANPKFPKTTTVIPTPAPAPVAPKPKASKDGVTPALM